MSNSSAEAGDTDGDRGEGDDACAAAGAEEAGGGSASDGAQEGRTGAAASDGAEGGETVGGEDVHHLAFGGVLAGTKL